MATVNFSVPEEVKEAFNEAFRGENKSAILTDLMRRAIEEHRRHERRERAIDAVLRIRRTQKPLSVAETRRSRRSGRS